MLKAFPSHVYNSKFWKPDDRCFSWLILNCLMYIKTPKSKKVHGNFVLGWKYQERTVLLEASIHLTRAPRRASHCLLVLSSPPCCPMNDNGRRHQSIDLRWCGSSVGHGGHTGICGSSSILGRTRVSEMLAISALHVNMIYHSQV